MNYREDLEIKLQKVTLAMQEVIEDIYKTDHEKKRIISKLIEYKEAIILKGNELNIELEAAQKYCKYHEYLIAFRILVFTEKVNLSNAAWNF